MKSKIEQLERRAQARKRLRAELLRRGLDAGGTELEQLERLESALEAESKVSKETEDKIRSDKHATMRK